MSDQIAKPQTDQDRAKDHRALSEMHPGNRFRLMFGMTLLPQSELTPISFQMTADDDFSDEERNLFREASQRALAIIVPAAQHISSASNFRVGLAQILFALDQESRSMRDVAASLNVTVACISKGAKEFVRDNNLPTPLCMKSDEASDVYRDVRISQLTKRTA